MIRTLADLLEPPIQHDIHFMTEEDPHAKIGPFNADPFPGFWGAVPCVNFKGADGLADCRKIAKAYGLDSYEQVEAIRYTFNIRGAISVTRSWVWEPKTGQISYEGVEKDGKMVKVTFFQSSSRPILPS